MKIGDIKAEALRLMFATYTDDVRAEDISNLKYDENYRQYLISMTGAINRCLSDIEKRRVLPVKTHALSLADAEKKRRAYRFDLSQLNDFYDVCRVVAEGEYTYEGDHPYFMEGSTLLLRGVDADDDYTLLYYPRLARLTEVCDDTAELEGVPEEIACLIPYFIKGDLYRDDEPNEAGEARNWYEAGMAMPMGSRTEKQGRVATVYSQVDV